MASPNAASVPMATAVDRFEKFIDPNDLQMYIWDHQNTTFIKSGIAVELFHALCRSVAKRTRAAIERSNNKTLLLQLKRPHYDAMRDRRKLWEARPLLDHFGRQSIYDKLAVPGNAAVLQSGANTNDRVLIAEVRRYIPKGLSDPLQDMVVELGADLLPDVADTKARAQVYEDLYTKDQCVPGFVAMRIEWPQ